MPPSPPPPADAASPRPGILRNKSSELATSPSIYLGLNAAVSPRSTPRSVSIATHAETISPLILGSQKSVEDFSLGNVVQNKRPAVKSARSRRLSGRLSITGSPPLKPLTPLSDRAAEPDEPAPSHVASLIDQVSAWIREERERRFRRKVKRASARPPSAAGDATGEDAARPRRPSDASDDASDLDKLETIVKQNLAISSAPRRPGSIAHRRKSSIKKLRHKSSVSFSSDTDYIDNDILVPSCDAVLDNTRTLAHPGGASDLSDESGSDDLKREPSYRDADAWASFKFEIVRLTHTLRLKGWRQVPVEMSNAIFVQRLSGALTNCVYVVSPPQGLPLQNAINGRSEPPKRAPAKLLLRIYGPQVEHLIDRETELNILQRLARKHIGPRLLGTFANGRFEEFFNAKTLTPEDLRDPATSKQIAKRMRELHDGVDLLDLERNDGPFVWRNWDKWLSRAEQVVSWMDEQVASLPPGVRPVGKKAWMKRGHICGVPWQLFRSVVEKYRAWLNAQYGSAGKVREQLVFAHNDTQYGNLLRLVPTGESPLLLPANSHRQLVVIDFEYSNANTPGFEFANHFTEWCYNYHDKRKPHACNTALYPTPEEQERFIRAYVRHRPQFNVGDGATPQASPMIDPELPSTPREPLRRPTTTISDFMLDARSPRAAVDSPSSSASIDATVKSAEDAELARLMRETRLWRLASSAQWVAWGLVQAKVPGAPDFGESDDPAAAAASIGNGESADVGEISAGVDGEGEPAPAKNEATLQGPEEEQEEFDYLGYVQHRAMFFWGDAIQLGFVDAQDLPEEMRAKVKTVPY